MCTLKYNIQATLSFNDSEVRDTCLSYLTSNKPAGNSEDYLQCGVSKLLFSFNFTETDQVSRDSLYDYILSNYEDNITKISKHTCYHEEDQGCLDYVSYSPLGEVID